MSAPRRGFALLTVLWMLVGVAVLSLLLLRTAREAIGAAANRQGATRAAWEAEGCAERARALMHEAFIGPGRDTAWGVLDRTIPGAPALRECDVALVPAGSTLNANGATVEQLVALFTAHGVGEARADSLAAAIADWRDADDQPRPAGAERDWYDAHDRAGPRDGPLLAAGELAGVRGLADVPGWEALLGVEPAPVWLGGAPPAVLAILPGFDATVLALALAERERDRRGLTVMRLANLLPPDARGRFESRIPQLMALTTSEPAAWTLVSTARAGSPAITRRVELRLLRAGSRAAIVARAGS